MVASSRPLAVPPQRPSDAAPSDADLLRAYAADHDENAFRLLVARYGPLVWGLCRRFLGAGPDAEDAFQATFLTLARRVATVRHGDALAAFLHGVVRRVASRARLARARRRAAESRVPAPAVADEPRASDMLAALDEEVARLPESYRAPILLCFWQGLTQAEAARQLGCSEGAVKGRLERGRLRLAARLTRRGFAPQILLAAAVGTAVPADLLARASALGTGSASATAAALALLDPLPMAAWTRRVFLAVGVLAAGVVAFVAGAVAPIGRVPSAPVAAADPPTPRPAVDALGDPLPEGAVTRIGTTRLRCKGSICVVTFSADGKRLAWGSEENRVYVADAADGRPLVDLALEKRIWRPTTELAFSPDGSLLAAGGFWSEKIRLIDIAGRRVTHEFPNGAEKQENWARLWQGPAFAFSPDGRTLVAGGKDGALHLWDVASGARSATLSAGTTAPVLSLTLSADGRRALTAHERDATHLWDLAERKHLNKRQDKSPYSPYLQFCALSPDGKAVAVATGHTEVELQEPNGKRRHVLRLGANIGGLGFAADGELLTADADGRVVAWDVATGEARRTTACDVRFHWKADSRQGPHPAAWFRPDGKAVAWADQGAIRIWDLTTGREMPPCAPYAQGAHWVGFSADGRQVHVGGFRGEVGAWDAATGRRGAFHRPARASNHNARFGLARGGRLVVVSGGDDIGRKPASGEGRVALWDLTDAAPVPLRGQVAPTYYATLTPDGRTLVAPEGDGTIRVYDTADGRLIRYFSGRKSEYCPTLSPDGRLLATAESGQTVRLYDFGSGRVLHELTGPGNARYVAFAPDGSRVASVHTPPLAPFAPAPNASEFIVLWDTATGRELRRIPTGEHVLTWGLAFSPDGRLIASGGFDQQVRVWEAASGQERRRYEGHRGWVNGVAFSPDGGRLASASGDGTALVWRLFDLSSADGDLDYLWSDLAKDGRSAHTAIGRLAAARGGAAFLAARLTPVRAPSDTERTRWLADLAGADFATREAAQRKLASLVEVIEAELRRALREVSDPEAKKRLTSVLEGIDRPEARPDDLRALRAVEALERSGSATARAALEDVARGAASAPLTRAARASLDRLSRPVPRASP